MAFPLVPVRLLYRLLVLFRLESRSRLSLLVEELERALLGNRVVLHTVNPMSISIRKVHEVVQQQSLLLVQWFMASEGLELLKKRTRRL